MALVTDRKRCMWIEAISDYSGSLIRTKGAWIRRLRCLGLGGTLTTGGT